MSGRVLHRSFSAIILLKFELIWRRREKKKNRIDYISEVKDLISVFKI